MNEQSLQNDFTTMLLLALEETFEKVNGMYLDRGTSLFETLAAVSAEEASRLEAGNCASIAAHVAHMHYYMDIILRAARDEQPQPDWSEIWRTVQAVTPDEWAQSQQRLREAYEAMCVLARETTWGPYEIRGALGMLMHNAYHLGEIRRMLCTMRA